MVNRKGNIRKSTRVKKIDSNFNISLIFNNFSFPLLFTYVNNTNYLCSIIRRLEREFRAWVEGLHVHKVHNPQVKTTYAFLRLVNSNIYPLVVQRLNGPNHGGRELNVKVNPLLTPAHR